MISKLFKHYSLI
jgi:hypothetical protein